VTSGTISGASATADGTGTGGSEEDLVARRANRVPSTSTTMMRGVINRSGMELVAGKAQQGRDAENRHHELNQTLYRIATTLHPISGRTTHFVALMAHRNTIAR